MHADEANGWSDSLNRYKMQAEANYRFPDARNGPSQPVMIPLMALPATQPLNSAKLSWQILTSLQVRYAIAQQIVLILIPDYHRRREKPI